MKGQCSIVNRQTEYRIGNRCHICTGCGCCQGGRKDIHVLTQSANTIGKKSDIMSDHGKRLVTVDIGTTTIAMQLHGRDGRVEDTFAVVNPQTVYGADVLLRIQAAENPADAERMQQMVREVLRQGICQFRLQIVQEGNEDIWDTKESLQMIIAANTTMVYLLMGYNTEELGKAPFHASHLQPIETVIEEVPCYIFPGMSAFVGGDIVAGILACGMYESEKITLLIDLGTNGEMVLGNQDKMIACSTAAAPAFEGGVNRGVWGADMIRILARLRQEGILDETGLLDEPYFEQGVCIGDVCVTQESVRAIQLAKGAILAGIRILIQEYGITMDQVDEVVLAGGFGYYLDPQEAAYINLLPKELANKTISGGNTALVGALELGSKILSDDEWKFCNLFQKVKNNIQIINLAEIDKFEELYFESMGF